MFEARLTKQLDRVAKDWVNILKDHSSPADQAYVHSELYLLVGQLKDLFLADPFQYAEAIRLGNRLGGFDGIDARTAEKMSEVLVTHLIQGLNPDEASAIQPKLAVLISGLTIAPDQNVRPDEKEDWQYDRELEALGVIARKLKYIGSNLGESLDLEQVLQQIVESVVRSIPTVERAVLHLLDEESNTLQPIAVNYSKKSTKPSLAMRPGEGIAGYVVTSGELLNIPDVQQDARYKPDESYKGLRSMLVVPVTRKGQILGTISAQSNSPHIFNAADEKILSELAFRSVIAIENARLYERERSQRVWAEALTEASAALTQSLDLDTVLNTILEQVLRVAPAKSANIQLIQNGEAVVVRRTGISQQPEAGEEISSTRLPLTLPVYQEMLITGKPVIIANTTQEPAWINIAGQEWIRAYAGAPLKEGDQVVGFLNIDSDQERAFDLETIRRLKSFADHASLALSNARLYDELRKALQQEQLMRNQLLNIEHLASMGRMVSLIAHALNNPLQSLVNSLYLTQMDVPPDSPVHDYLAIANSDVKRLTMLVSQLRQVYQPGRLKEKQPVALKDLLDSVYQLVDSQLKRNNIKWHQQEVPTDLMVYGVPSQLLQVFLNISINALEAMPPEGGEIFVSWQTAAKTTPLMAAKDTPLMAAKDTPLMAAKDTPEAIPKPFMAHNPVGVSFRDTGRGIPSKDIEKLFDPYFTTKDTGIGLGLTTCDEIIKQHNGKIEVESQMGQGTAVTVWLPQQET